MTLFRLFILTMAVIAGISVDSYAGCGASKPLGKAIARSKSADGTVEPRSKEEQKRIRRAVSCAVESLVWWYAVQHEDLTEIQGMVEQRLAQSGAVIAQYNGDGEVVDALVKSGIGLKEAADLVAFARMVSNGYVALQMHAEENANEQA